MALSPLFRDCAVASPPSPLADCVAMREKGRHSGESRNPERHWIPEPAPYSIRGQARNDKPERTYVGTHKETMYGACA